VCDDAAECPDLGSRPVCHHAIRALSDISKTFAVIGPTLGISISRCAVWSSRAARTMRRLEATDVVVESLPLPSQQPQGRSRQFGDRSGRLVHHLRHQAVHALQALRCDEPELRAASPQRICRHGPLPHQQHARAVEHQNRLALHALDSARTASSDATVQPTSVQSPLHSACHACAGTIACGMSPAARSGPSLMLRWPL
jgi:hypothetical protein